MSLCVKKKRLDSMEWRQLGDVKVERHTNVTSELF